MALSNFSSPNCVLYINGRQISEFGQSTTPVSISQLNDSAALVQGMNGNAVRYDTINEGWGLSVALLPDTDDSAFLSSIANAKGGDVYATYVTISTGETVTLAEGIFTSRGALNRGGTGFGDDEFNFQFNVGSVDTGK